MNYHKLDPANYLSAPSLAWDAMLLLTDIELELITDLKILVSRKAFANSHGSASENIRFA